MQVIVPKQLAFSGWGTDSISDLVFVKWNNCLANHNRQVLTADENNQDNLHMGYRKLWKQTLKTKGRMLLQIYKRDWKVGEVGRQHPKNKIITGCVIELAIYPG